jgi:hypothetical protein
MLYTHLSLGLPSGVFPSGLPTDILFAFLFSSISYLNMNKSLVINVFSYTLVDKSKIFQIKLRK